jgi:nucleotide-binding universal stress UspA family protein
MFPPEKILFPVDFSERCTAAARMAEIFTGHFQAELTLLHVVEPLTYNDVPVDLNTIGERQLSGYLVEELKQFNVKRVLMHGDPSSRILEYAKSRDFDLIMLPTHGYGTFRRLMLGSVTANVLHEALCPVWTGVHMEQVPRLEDIAFSKIICALDLGTQSCPTLRWAQEFSSEFGADLQIVHAIPETSKDAAFADEAEETLLSRAEEKIRDVQQCVGADAKVTVLVGDAPRAVCGLASQYKADLLVIGRSVHTGLAGRLRANAYAIIRQSPCPVVSV